MNRSVKAIIHPLKSKVMKQEEGAKGLIIANKTTSLLNNNLTH